MTTCRGIDVSAYQGSQDWAEWKAEGVVFAFAKASEGQTSRDPKFAAHITAIKAAGLVPGGYHFAWPNQDPKREAANYITAVKAYASEGFTHWLDLERYSDGRNYRGKSDKQILEWVSTWLAAVRTAFPGQRVGVYTSADDLAKGHVPAGVPLWYPAYPGARVDTYAEAEAHAQPSPSGWKPLIWQFTSDPAGPDRIDQSIAYMSAADFRAWAGLAQSKPPTTNPKVSLAHVVYAAKHDPAATQGHTTYKAEVLRIEKALAAEKLLASQYVDGSFGTKTVAAYRAWQRKLGYTGFDADGIPGQTSLKKLGDKHGFQVTS